MRWRRSSIPRRVRPHLLAVKRSRQATPTAGPIAQLDTTERFHWLTAPSSTVLQPSRVHTDLGDDPAERLDHLFGELVT